MSDPSTNKEKSTTIPSLEVAAPENIPRFSDPPSLEHPMPAWVINRTSKKNKKELKLRLPSRPAFAPPPRGMETQITRPSPHTAHMFTPRAIESATEKSHVTRVAESLAMKKPIVSYKRAPIRPAVGKQLQPFPYKNGSSKYREATISPRADSGNEYGSSIDSGSSSGSSSGSGSSSSKTFSEEKSDDATLVSAAKVAAIRNAKRTEVMLSPKSKKRKELLSRDMSLESVDNDEMGDIVSGAFVDSSNVDDPQYLRIDLSKLPLELFDSSIYDTKTPEEWLLKNDGTNENTGTTTGKSMYWVGNEWIWRSCDVLSYDAESMRYTLRFRGSQRLKKVRRINIRFDHENPINFEKRILAAKKAREECKAQLRLQHYMQDMPVENVAPIRSKILKSICTRIAMPLVSGASRRGVPFDEDSALSGEKTSKEEEEEEEEE